MTDEPENPYQPPASEVADLARAGTPADLSAQLRAYVGYGHEHYVPRWERRIRGERRGTGFSWGACLFGCFFFFYRRMYVVGLLVLGIDIATAVILGLAQGFLGVGQDLVGIVAILFALIRGYFGYDIYLAWARLEIRRLEEAGLEGRELIQTLRRSNGPNYWLPALIVFGGFGTCGLIAALAQQ